MGDPFMINPYRIAAESFLVWKKQAFLPAK
jgi:hypothetical protein